MPIVESAKGSAVAVDALLQELFVGFGPTQDFRNRRYSHRLLTPSPYFVIFSKDVSNGAFVSEVATHVRQRELVGPVRTFLSERTNPRSSSTGKPGRASMLRNRLAAGAVGALIALTVAGCASAGPSEAPAPPGADNDFLCSGLSISREALETRVPVSAIDEPGRTALSEAVWDDGSPLDLPPEEDWYVATMTDGLVGVLRDVELQADPASMTILPDREVLTVTRVEHATNLTPGWYVSQSDTCALTVDLGDLTVPEVTLQSAPDPTSQELHLLVTEESCNSGKDAAGRIEIVSLEETSDRVSLVLGVRPRGGSQTCPSNPATPFTLTLSEPLGERDLVDASLADPRPLTLNG